MSRHQIHRFASPQLALGIVYLWLAPSLPAQVAGVEIDAEGVLRAAYSRTESATLAGKRMRAFAQEHLPGELTVYTDMRMVSLRAIEAELTDDGGTGAVNPDMQYLYGLQRIDYVFIDDVAGDVVLAGPAEGFAPDPSGRLIGLTTGRPPICLDDLLVALRWAAETGARGQIGCSIDPVPENQAALQRWLQANSNAVSRQAAQARYDVMARILGRQVVSVFNVPDDSHFARILVEADYRMKLIAMGKEQPGVKGLRSQLSLLTPQGNSIQRWWFVPFYEPIGVDAAGLSYQLSGQRLQLLAQDEWADHGGRRSDAAFTRTSTEKFAQLFTEHIPELAEKSPVFAELQNVFDLAVVAALLQREDWPRRLNWPMVTLLNAERWPVRQYPVPKAIDSLATTANRNRFVLGMVGGVTLDAGEVIGQRREGADAKTLATLREHATTTAKKPRPTWWDK